jgi:hypothetical protein
LIVLAAVGHRDDPIYQEFLSLFIARVGGTPLWVTLWAAIIFYSYAALRGVPAATEALTAALAALAFITTDSLTFGDLVAPRPAPLLIAATLQLALSIDRNDVRRGLLGMGGLVVVMMLTLPEEAAGRDWIGLHLALGGLLFLGASFDDTLARCLRNGAAVLVLPVCVITLSGALDVPADVPAWLLIVYPLVMATLLAGYGLRLRHRLSIAMAGLIVVGWLTGAGWWGYCGLRRIISGLDYIAVSLAFFAVAVLVSLGKAGALSRTLGGWWDELRLLLRWPAVIDARSGRGEKLANAIQELPDQDSEE